jgi:hypothetical protein
MKEGVKYVGVERGDGVQKRDSRESASEGKARITYSNRVNEPSL